MHVDVLRQHAAFVRREQVARQGMEDLRARAQVVLPPDAGDLPIASVVPRSQQADVAVRLPEYDSGPSDSDARSKADAIQ